MFGGHAFEDDLPELLGCYRGVNEQVEPQQLAPTVLLANQTRQSPDQLQSVACWRLSRIV
jgi:hypothetical protein